MQIRLLKNLVTSTPTPDLQKDPTANLKSVLFLGPGVGLDKNKYWKNAGVGVEVGFFFFRCMGVVVEVGVGVGVGTSCRAETKKLPAFSVSNNRGPGVGVNKKKFSKKPEP